MIFNLLQSIRLLADASRSFADRCVAGLRANEARIRELVDRSLMLVTALNRHIGYDNAAKIAKRAHVEGITLKEAAATLGLVSADEFDTLVRPEAMLAPR
jgi:fumarate hydratase class II